MRADYFEYVYPAFFIVMLLPISIVEASNEAEKMTIPSPIRKFKQTQVTNHMRCILGGKGFPGKSRGVLWASVGFCALFWVEKQMLARPQ
jgi:hypothetical protein